MRKTVCRQRRMDCDGERMPVCKAWRMAERRDGSFARKTGFGTGEDACETGLRERPGHDRIRHFGGSSCRDCHSCHNRVQAEAGRALAGDSHRNTRSVRQRLRRGRDAERHFRKVLKGFRGDERGQSTVEYAVLMAAGLSMIVAAGLLANAVGDGVFVEHALSAASHNVSSSAGGFVDVFCF